MKLSPASFLSVGLDVGTTTTHLTISRLHFANSAAFTEVPKLTITEREVIHHGQIHLTPVTSDGIIDAEGVARLVDSEYRKLGIDSSLITAGAAIITGESARLRNAEEVIEKLAKSCGQFVVASAGPHLEGILAAKGSGAQEASIKRGKTIMNVDIGGGTVNAAVYSNGNLIDSACLCLGGRFLSFSPDGILVGMTDFGEKFIQTSGKQYQIGEKISLAELSALAQRLAELILDFLAGMRSADPFLITEPLKAGDYQVDEIWFSGGVATLMKEKSAEPFLYGDMGPLLGKFLMAACERRNVNCVITDKAIRATVLGAGMHTLQLSGTTINVALDALPIRNLPMLRPFQINKAEDNFFRHEEDEGTLESALTSQIKSVLKRHDIEWSSTKVAVVMEALQGLSYGQLKRIAKAMASAFRTLKGRAPLVLVTENDLAMALGQLLRHHLNEEEIVVLDGISAEGGDYIDIGLPIREVSDSNTMAIPVVVKSLVFNKSG